MECYVKNVVGCREILCLILVVLNLFNLFFVKLCREGIFKNWIVFQYYGGIQVLNNNKLKYNNF